MKDLIDSLVNPLNYFYLGILASIGLTMGLVGIFSIIRNLFETDILIYSRIFFSISYVALFTFTYWFINMRENKALRNGFIFFAVLYALGQVYIWIS